MNQQSTLTRSGGKGNWLSLSCYVLLVLVFAIIFRKTIFAGLPVSFVYLLGYSDSIVNPNLTADPSPFLCVCDQANWQLHLPYNVFENRALYAGRLPLWNPYNGCGIPFLADIQTYALSPLRFLFAAENSYLYNLGIIIQTLFSSLAMFAFCRRVQLSRAAAFFGALTFAYCPMIISVSERTDPAFFIPVVALAVSYVSARKPLSILLAGAVCAVAIFSNHPEPCIYTLGLAWPTGAVAHWINKRRAIASYQPGAMMQWLPFALIPIVAFLIAAPVLLPFIEFLLNSDCYKTIFLDRWVVPAKTVLFQLLAPIQGGVSLYLGPLLFPLLFISMMSRTRRAWSFLILLSVCLLFTLDSPISAAFYSIPLINWFQPYYCLFLCVFFLALTASFGLEEVVTHCRGEGICLRNLFSIFVGMAAFNALIMVLYQPTVFWMSLEGCERPKLPSWTIAFSILIALALVEIVMQVTKKWRAFPLILSTIIIVANFAITLPEIKRALAISPSFEFMRQTAVEKIASSQSRFVGLGKHLVVPNSSIFHNLRDIRVEEVMHVKRYNEYFTAAGGNWNDIGEFYFDKADSALFNLASVKYLFNVGPLEATLDSIDLPKWIFERKLQNNVYFYKNDNALPRAYFAREARGVTNPADGLRMMQEKGFVSGRKAVIETGNSNIFPVACRSQSATIEKDLPELVEIHTESDAFSLLVLTDAYYPGWQVSVDGKPSHIWRTNYLFRGVFVPPGSHRVTFSYFPKSLIIGIWLAEVTIFVFLAGFAGGVMRKKMRSRQGCRRSN